MRADAEAALDALGIVSWPMVEFEADDAIAAAATRGTWIDKTLMVLGLVGSIVLASGSMLKALAMAILGLVSPDGEDGYPGRLDVRLTYRLKEPANFAVSIEAGCNGVEATIVLAAAILAFPAPSRWTGGRARSAARSAAAWHKIQVPRWRCPA